MAQTSRFLDVIVRLNPITCSNPLTRSMEKKSLPALPLLYLSYSKNVLSNLAIFQPYGHRSSWSSMAEIT
jgi:hypothetical protein